MSKKSKLKRKKYQYTEYEFVQAVCNKCGLCKTPIYPEFCYNCVYKDNPKKFTKIILEQLFDVRHWLSNAGYPSIALCPDDSIQHILQTVFCDSDFCGKSPGEDQQCKAVAGCLHSFRKQIKGLDNNLAIFNDACNTILGNNVIYYQDFKNKKKQKQKYKYVVAAPRTPTFFCNDGFKKEIGEILDGYNDREQD
jgi:hypothetical protein